MSWPFILHPWEKDKIPWYISIVVHACFFVIALQSSWGFIKTGDYSNHTHVDTFTHSKTRWQGQKLARKGDSVGILVEISIFQHADICVRVCVVWASEQADRLWAGSLVIQGCFHFAYSCYVGEDSRFIHVGITYGNWYQNIRKSQMDNWWLGGSSQRAGGSVWVREVWLSLLRLLPPRPRPG